MELCCNKLASISKDNSIKIWDSLSQAQIHTIKLPDVGNDCKRHLCFSKNGSKLAFGAKNILCCIDIDGNGLLPSTIFHPVDELLVTISLNFDGSRLAAVNTAGDLILWNTICGEKILHLRSLRVMSIAVSNDGKWVVSGGRDRTVRLINLETKIEECVFNGHESSVKAVDINHEGTTILSGAKDGSIRLWNVGSRALLKVLLGHGNSIMRCAFSPEGSRFVSGSRDGTMIIWNFQVFVQFYFLVWWIECVFFGRLILGTE